MDWDHHTFPQTQHSKDRMFLTATAWKGLGGKKADTTNKSYRPLPFDACALSLQPFEVRPSIHTWPPARPTVQSRDQLTDRGDEAKLNPLRLKF